MCLKAFLCVSVVDVRRAAMKYLVYALGATVFWGFWGFLPRLAVKGLDFSSAQVWNWIGGKVIIVPSARFFGAKVGAKNPKYFYAVVAGHWRSLVGQRYTH